MATITTAQVLTVIMTLMRQYRPGVSLELAEVLTRRAEGWPEVHITAAAVELLTHLLATGEKALSEESALMTLARIGAQAIVTRAESDEDR